MIGRFDLTDWEWSIIAPLLPGGAGKKGRGRPRPNGWSIDAIEMIEQARLGAICRSGMGPIRPSTTASTAGPSAGCGERCSGPWLDARPTACG